MKSYFFFIIGGFAALLMQEFLFKSKPSVIEYEFKHPKITSEQDIYQINLNDSIADVCYDIRHKKVVIVSGYFIEQRCELDSNRYHFNIKTK